MPSLRQKVTTYFRQLSFIAEPRDSSKTSHRTDDNDDDNNFIIKYLAGRMNRIFTPGPEIYNGHNPTDMPDMKIAAYPTGPNTITAACTGPDDGLTGIKRSKLHLNANYGDDIDFIDTAQENDAYEVRKSISNNINTNLMNINSNANSISTIRNSHNKFQRHNSSGRRVSGSSMGSGGTGSGSGSGGSSGPNNSTAIGNYQNTNKTGSSMIRSRKNSRSSLHSISTQSHNKDNNVSMKMQQHNNNRNEENLNKSTTIVVSMVSTKPMISSSSSSQHSSNVDVNDQNNRNLLNTKTDSINKNNLRQSTKDQQSHNVGVDACVEKTEISEKSGNIDKRNGGDDTERLLRNTVTSQSASHSNSNEVNHSILNDQLIAGVNNWKMDCDAAYGISVSLYENNMLTKEPMGNPIADCYGIVVRDNVAVMALADGVNWGDGARLAARSAVHGSLDYLDRAIFGLAGECIATTTQEVFVSLLRSLWEGHGCILEVGGALSTLTIAVVLPLEQSTNNMVNACDEMDKCEKYVVCACNVGDSLGYVYSKKHGVREFTMASHDIASMRDMRDALGALGPADGNKPELSNLTFSMTIIDKGDIVFLTSDGISDNFDPVVGKFAEAWTMNSQGAPHSMPTVNLASKRQNRSASALHNRTTMATTTTATSTAASSTNHVTSIPVRPPRTKLESSAGKRPKYMRSHTVIEPGYTPQMSPPHGVKTPKSPTGLPLVTGPQRHSLTLHRLEDLLSYGINGTFSPCSSARRLCHLLIDFVRMITLARRKTLEQRELFYKVTIGADGKKREIEMNRVQHRAARKRIIESSIFSSLPGKLDHASVVAFTAGGIQMIENATSQNQNSNLNGDNDKTTPTTTTINGNGGHMTASLQTKEFKETNF